MIKFLEKVENIEDIKVVLIMARYDNKWIFCKKENTYECPGGHVEKDEFFYSAACRELEEETGAEKYDISFVSFFLLGDTIEFGEDILGAYYVADIYKLGELLYEVKEIGFFRELPKHLSYPSTQIELMKKVHL